MKVYGLLLAALLAGAGKANAQAGNTQKTPPAQTTCYVSTDGGKTYMNALRVTRMGPKVKGELIYMMENEVPMKGEINGTIKDNILVADWSYIRAGKYYKVPVSFKITETGAWQKPSAVNDKGVAYLPEEADFLYEFPKADCSTYPEMPQKPVKLK